MSNATDNYNVEESAMGCKDLSSDGCGKFSYLRLYPFWGKESFKLQTLVMEID